MLKDLAVVPPSSSIWFEWSSSLFTFARSRSITTSKHHQQSSTVDHQLIRPSSPSSQPKKTKRKHRTKNDSSKSNTLQQRPHHGGLLRWMLQWWATIATNKQQLPPISVRAALPVNHCHVRSCSDSLYFNTTTTAATIFVSILLLLLDMTLASFLYHSRCFCYYCYYYCRFLYMSFCNFFYRCLCAVSLILSTSVHYFYISVYHFFFFFIIFLTIYFIIYFKSTIVKTVYSNKFIKNINSTTESEKITIGNMKHYFQCQLTERLTSNFILTKTIAATISIFQSVISSCSVSSLITNTSISKNNVNNNNNTNHYHHHHHHHHYQQNQQTFYLYLRTLCLSILFICSMVPIVASQHAKQVSSE